jgi:anti-anti-sigma factor
MTFGMAVAALGGKASEPAGEDSVQGGATMSVQAFDPGRGTQDPDGPRVIALHGGRVGHDENEIAAELAGLRVGPEALVLDLAAVQSLTSSELGTLAGLHRRARAAGGRLTLVNLNPQLYAVFDRLMLTTFLEVHPRTPARAEAET